MRYQVSAANQFQSFANATSATIPSISSHPHFGHQINQVYYAYPRFLMARLEAEILERLYFPWERVEEREPLYIHISTTHHWPLAEVRQMDEAQLLEILRPEIQKLRLPARDAEEILRVVGNLMPADLRKDIESRVDRD